MSLSRYSRGKQEGESSCFPPAPSWRPDGAGMLEGKGVTPCAPAVLHFENVLCLSVPQPLPKAGQMLCSSNLFLDPSEGQPPKEPIQHPSQKNPVKS